jgi:hypothetical protein
MDSAAEPVLLNARYQMLGALKQSNIGGVYLAEDCRTGDQVVLREARPHTDPDIHRALHVRGIVYGDVSTNNNIIIIIIIIIIIEPASGRCRLIDSFDHGLSGIAYALCRLGLPAGRDVARHVHQSMRFGAETPGLLNGLAGGAWACLEAEHCAQLSIA